MNSGLVMVVILGSALFVGLGCILCKMLSEQIDWKSKK